MRFFMQNVILSILHKNTNLFLYVLFIFLEIKLKISHYDF